MSRVPLQWTDEESDSIAWALGMFVALGTTFLVVTCGWFGGVVMAAFCFVKGFIHYRRAFPRLPASRSVMGTKGDSSPCDEQSRPGWSADDFPEITADEAIDGVKAVRRDRTGDS